MKFEVKTIQFAPNIYKKSFKRRFEFESISLKLQRAIKSLKKKKEKEEREKEGKKGGALGRLWKEKKKGAVWEKSLGRWKKHSSLWQPRKLKIYGQLEVHSGSPQGEPELEIWQKIQRA